MNVSEAIRARRSIRKYRPDAEIPQAHIEAILEAAMAAPSACNTRPWEFTVVGSREIKEKIVKVHPFCRQLLTASVGIVVCGRPDLQAGKGSGYWPQDCGAAIENMLLQALELGYGSCWCGLYPREERAAAVKEIIGCEGVPLAVVTLGTADEKPERRGFYDASRVRWL